MRTQRKILVGAVVAAALGTGAGPQGALASGAGAFIGGMMAARVMTNVREQTEAEQTQAYYAHQAAQRPVQQAAPAPAAPAQLSPQQRMQQLDKLAAGGYITPEQYKAKKQAIVDGM